MCNWINEVSIVGIVADWVILLACNTELNEHLERDERVREIEMSVVVRRMSEFSLFRYFLIKLKSNNSF